MALNVHMPSRKPRYIILSPYFERYHNLPPPHTLEGPAEPSCKFTSTCLMKSSKFSKDKTSTKRRKSGNPWKSHSLNFREVHRGSNPKTDHPSASVLWLKSPDINMEVTSKTIQNHNESPAFPRYSALHCSPRGGACVVAAASQCAWCMAPWQPAQHIVFHLGHCTCCPKCHLFVFFDSKATCYMFWLVKLVTCGVWLVTSCRLARLSTLGVASKRRDALAWVSSPPQGLPHRQEDLHGHLNWSVALTNCITIWIWWQIIS